jgi:hypothetical protein
MLTLLPNKGAQTQLLKFLIKDFSICLRCQRCQWCTLSCEFLKKFAMVLMGHSGTWGKKPEVENLVVHNSTLERQGSDSLPSLACADFLSLSMG